MWKSALNRSHGEGLRRCESDILDVSREAWHVTVYLIKWLIDIQIIDFKVKLTCLIWYRELGSCTNRKLFC